MTVGDTFLIYFKVAVEFFTNFIVQSKHEIEKQVRICGGKIK